MKIRRFNEDVKFNLTNYTPELESEVQKNNNDVQVRYYVTLPDEKYPLSKNYNTSFEQALNRMNDLNENWKDTYCLFESKVKIMTSEDISLKLSTEKYNL